MYLRGQPDYLHEDWLGKSVPVQMSNIAVGQIIRDREKDVAYFNLLNNFNVGFTLSFTYFSSFFAILALSFLIAELSQRIRFGRREMVTFSKRIALSLSKFQNKRRSAIGIYLLFVHLFLWVTQLFLVNNIKTNKVVRLNRKN